MNIRASILAQLKATHAGDPWYGSSGASLLAGLTADEAASRPIEGAHTIWELVLHMTSWRREVERRLRGASPAEPIEGDWPKQPQPTREGWNEAQAELAGAHAELIAAVEALPEADWGIQVGPNRDPALGTGVDMAGMIVGLAQHDAYHLGQVGILRKAL